MHVGDYRYSADLDFSVVNGTLDEERTALQDVVAHAKEQADFPLLELTEDAKPMVQYIGPLAATKPRELKVDIATDEFVESVESKVILPVWDDLPESLPFDVYPVGEIAAEKLRCVIQRLQCRDLFDLYQLADSLDVVLSEVRPLFEQKARVKGLDPGLFASKFDERTGQYERRWIDEMSGHVPNDPPDFNTVIRVVRRHLRAAGLLAEG